MSECSETIMHLQPNEPTRCSGTRSGRTTAVTSFYESSLLAMDTVWLTCYISPAKRWKYIPRVPRVFVCSWGLKEGSYLPLRWVVLVSCQVEDKQKLPAELLKAWGVGGGNLKNKREPLEQCHPNLLPLRACLFTNLPTMHLDPETDYWTQKYWSLKMEATFLTIMSLGPHLMYEAKLW